MLTHCREIKNKMASSSSSYSFWLVPPHGTPVRDRAQRLIDALAIRHGSPRFIPHITLHGGFSGNAPPSPSSNSKATPSSSPPSPSPSSDAALAARALAASHPAFSKPLRINLIGVSSGSEYHRCVYALAEVSEGLRAAAAAAGEAALGVEAASLSSLPAPVPPPVKPDDDFMPHLSLLYSSDPRAREEGLAEASAAFAKAFREGGGEGETAATAAAAAAAGALDTPQLPPAAARQQGDAGASAPLPAAGTPAGTGEAAAGEGCCSWLSSEIEVWLTEGAVEDWRCEARVPFGKA